MRLGVVRALSLNYRVNLLGLASALLLFYTALSNKPWWTMSGGAVGGQSFLAEVSPFSIVVEILGKPVEVPILPYLTLAARLTILLAAASILIASSLATKPWSKPLMNVRGLILPILFLATLYLGLSLAGSYVGVNLPLVGESTLEYVVHAGELNITTKTPMEAGFTQEYWLALAAGVVSAFGKAVHGRIVKTEKPTDR
jgi:hypothetical protein